MLVFCSVHNLFCSVHSLFCSFHNCYCSIHSLFCSIDAAALYACGARSNLCIDQKMKRNTKSIMNHALWHSDWLHESNKISYERNQISYERNKISYERNKIHRKKLNYTIWLCLMPPSACHSAKRK